MNKLDLGVFDHLYKEACFQCFGHPLKDPLTETDSKRFCDQVFEHTGLFIGWKSIKNYSFFVLGKTGNKAANPSMATLDTLARYVTHAPPSTEIERKKTEGHYPYWYRYKEQWHRSRAEYQEVAGAPPESLSTGIPATGKSTEAGFGKRKWIRSVLGIAAVLILGLFILIATRPGAGADSFRDEFHALGADSLAARGWFVKSIDTPFWNRRGATPGGLTLFTLKGDNWPDPAQKPGIRNLVLRKIPCDCFILEIHLRDFLPTQNWQQAGVLLLEDTGYLEKSIRISIAYNDFAGGYPKEREIIVQAISSLGSQFDKPEEIAHIPLYNVDSLEARPILYRNLAHSALRIEKKGEQFRFLYANGAAGNTSFKEIATHSFPMTARYAGLFALKGFVDSTAERPACFSFFGLDCRPCDK